MYAGDKNDDYCKSCDGITLVDGSNKYEATRCEGYEPSETKEVEVSKETEDVKEPTETYTSQATTKSIRFESGISREINGMWYKFNYSEERVLPEGSDVDEEIKLLCSHCNRIIDEKIFEVINSK